MPNRVLTIPNIITIARLIFLVPFVFIALESPVLGAVIAAVLGFSDYLDGWIARRFNQQSELGRILDPISDRALMLTSFITFLAINAIPIWFAVLVGAREIAVVLGTAFIFSKKRVRLDVNHIGKISAFAAMAATPCWVVASETSGTAHVLWTAAALVASAIAIPTGYYSLIEYLRAYSKA